MKWINLAQNRAKWHVTLNMVMNFKVLKNVDSFTESCYLFNKESAPWNQSCRTLNLPVKSSLAFKQKCLAFTRSAVY